MKNGIENALARDYNKIVYKCKKCGQHHKNIVAADDNFDAIINISTKKGV
jgi:uncharacterized Zn finger protein